MAEPHKLREIEKSHGDLNKLIPKLLNKYGTQKAVADELGVSQTTIALWLQANGYVRVVRFEKSKHHDH
jgi:hypothetical protein